MCKSVVPSRVSLLFLFLAAFTSSASAQFGILNLNWSSKLDPALQQQASNGSGRSRVILYANDLNALASLSPSIKILGGKLGRSLPLVNGIVADVPNGQLKTLAGLVAVAHIAHDRVIFGAMERTSATVGAIAVRQNLGYDGTGVGVAVIDSGNAATLDDLSKQPGGGSRVDSFVDFVNGAFTPYDDYGHGTHVAGIIAGNGYDSGGARTGIAPGAHLISLKVLDSAGHGRISDVIAAIDYAIVMKDLLNIRVINLSIATGVSESYNIDPLTLAAQRAVSAGIVVVAAGGNLGRSSSGNSAYGGVTAPGNAPWVLTVGASSHMGTVDRSDDTVAAFSSRGPGAIDYEAKPDLVAPGVGIESLSDPSSAFYVSKAAYLLGGTVPTSYLPYLSLSGTSMSAPVVTGTVALMLQANPQLTPNAVKAILQYTAQHYDGYNALTQGTGFLNAKGAVDLAQFLASPSGTAYPATDGWSTQIIWGNKLRQGGQLSADANAWSPLVTWGASTTLLGERITFGSSFETGLNVVWGSRCGGSNCHSNWSVHQSGGAIDGSDDGDTVVWGTDDEGDTVVWGTDDEGDTVVWGTSCSDPSCEPVIWPRP